MDVVQCAPRHGTPSTLGLSAAPPWVLRTDTVRLRTPPRPLTSPLWDIVPWALCGHCPHVLMLARLTHGQCPECLSSPSDVIAGHPVADRRPKPRQAVGCVAFSLELQTLSALPRLRPAGQALGHCPEGAAIVSDKSAEDGERLGDHPRRNGRAQCAPRPKSAPIPRASTVQCTQCTYSSYGARSLAARHV